MSEQVLPGGSENPGTVVRMGDTVRRPRRPGHEVVESLLEHLERVGFDGSPRFLGIDRDGRQVLEYVDGTAHRTPPWQHDDAANAAELRRIAAWLLRLHTATAGYHPPADAAPRRPLPVMGDVWTHGDVGYPNIVYRGQQLVALVDWEFAAPAHRCCDPASLLAVSIRGPRPDVDDNERRAHAAKLAVAAIAAGSDMDDAELRSLPGMAATVLEDAIAFLGGAMTEADRERSLWRSRWFRDNADFLVAL